MLQFALVDVLLNNWDAIRFAMGTQNPSFEEALAAIARRLAAAASPDEFALVIDDLLELTSDTPAQPLVRQLLARSSEGGTTVRSIYKDGPAPEVESRFAASTEAAAQQLATVIVQKAEFVEVPVFFATNRKRDDSGRYSGEAAAQTSRGLAHVTVPVSHRVGKLETPSWWSRFSSKSPEERFVTLAKVEPLADADFAERLSGTGTDLVVFLHGYNVTFDEAARRAAQVLYDLRIPGAVVLFSWPSLGRTLAYSADEDRAAAAAKPLADFLKSLAGGPWKRVHIVAHSMGNRVAVNALADHPQPDLPLKEIALVAADVEASIFEQKFADLAERSASISSYASKVDRALVLSHFLHRSNRIGLIRKDPYTHPGMETVDATWVDTSLLGHSYFCDERSVITDLGYLLREGLPAARRGLFQPPGKPYWSFPR